MALKKPTKTAREFIEQARDESLGLYVETMDFLNEKKLTYGYRFLEDVLKRSVWRIFREELEEAHRYWGGDEIREIVRELQLEDLYDLFGYDHLVEYHKRNTSAGIKSA